MIVGAVLLGLAVAACSSTKETSSTPASASGTTIAVGVIGGLTGSSASSAAQVGTVAPAWAKWINANGGIDGHPVKVYVEDDKNDPATAQAVGNDLMSKGVVAIVAGSDNMVAAFDGAAIAKGIPVISGSANSIDWYTKAGLFPTPTGVLPGVGAQVTVAKQFGHATKFAVAYCAEIAACQQVVPIMQSQAKTIGIGFTSISVSGTAPSYTAQCLQLKQQQVDYVQLDFATETAVKFVQDCQAQNFNPTWGGSEQVVGGAFTKLQNFTLFGPAYSFPSAATSAPVATFTAAMEKYATDQNWKDGSASFTWDGLQVLAKAIKQARISPSAPVSPQAVLAGLYSFKNEMLAGELANGLTYTQGKAVGFNYNPCYFVVGMQGGKVTAPAGLTPQCPSGSPKA